MIKILVTLMLISRTCFCVVSLADSAAKMTPGQWLTIPMRIDSVAKGDVHAYTSRAVWDSKTKQILFMGAGYSHRIWNFIRYESLNDLWIHDFNLGFDSMSAQPSGATHAYQNMAMDTSGILYYNYDSLYRYNPVTQKWLPAYAAAPFSSRFGSLEFFPEMNGFTYVLAGTVKLFDLSTHTWRLLATNVPMGGSYDNISEYDPVHHCLVFGGGADYTPLADVNHKELNRLNADGTITPLADAPVAVGNHLQAHMVCDESTGMMIVVGTDSVYALDPVNNVWTNLGKNSAVNAGVTFHIREYGVVGFMPLINYAFQNLVLYKYAPSEDTVKSALEKKSAGRVSETLSALPNPFKSTVTIGFQGFEKCDVSVYDIAGKRIASFSQLPAQWDAHSFPSGIYSVRAVMHGKTFTKRIHLLR